MVEGGKLEMQGNMKNMKELEVRLNVDVSSSENSA